MHAMTMRLEDRTALDHGLAIIQGLSSEYEPEAHEGHR